jgi:transposase-like protein
MDKDSSKGPAEQTLFAGEAWFDPIEAGLRGRIRGLIEELVEQELEAALGRGRYERAGGAVGHRHGHWPSPAFTDTVTRLKQPHGTPPPSALV